MKHNEIFKKDSKGKTRVWFMESEEGRYRAVSGLYRGKLITDEWTYVSIKNAGKANETSLQEQTLKEVEAKYARKLEKDYHCILDDIETKLYFAPMLADTYNDSMNVTGYYSQPKLNGMRCIIKNDGAWTRKGKPIVSIPHIIESLKETFEENPTLVLDGELYNHNMHDDFNTLMSICRKSKCRPEELEMSKNNIEYHLYDVPCDLPFTERKNLLDKYKNLPYIVSVDTTLVQSHTHLDEIYKDYLLSNYEGQMIRSPNGKYENKRSKHLIKRKTFVDNEFKIKNVIEGKGNWSGVGKVIHAVTEDGEDFYPTVKGTREYCRQLLIDKDKYINGTVKVKYFSITPDGVPLFPVAIDIIAGERED